MDNQPINFEEYVQAFSKTMADAVAQAETLQGQAEAERDAAHEDEDALRDLLHKLENEANRAAEDTINAIYKRVNGEMTAMLTSRLKQAGWDENKITLLFE
ncbi:MAG: hypothetical protein ACKVU2_09250 [Saprospiraceae bacterium]